MTAPGSDAVERALTIINRIRKRYGQDPLMQAPDYWEEEFARALQQYGDERAAEARETMRQEALGIMDEEGRLGLSYQRIRALHG